MFQAVEYDLQDSAFGWKDIPFSCHSEQFGLESFTEKLNDSQFSFYSTELHDSLNSCELLTPYILLPLLSSVHHIWLEGDWIL